MDNGRIPQQQASSYIRYLPAIYQENAFLGRFLRLLEDILSPIEQTVDTLPERFDPRLTPPPMLDFLATWVGAQRPPRLPESRWRQLVGRSLWLHRWRGTKRGLRLALELATGERPLITEHGPGLTLGLDASLGVNTSLADSNDPHITVTFACASEAVDTLLVNDILRLYKPAHIPHNLSFISSGE